MARRVFNGVLAREIAALTSNSETFSAGFGAWSTPGVEADAGDFAWTFNAEGGVLTAGTGPDGGANPSTGAIETTGNGYAYTESNGISQNADESPYALESPQLDASQFTFTLKFQLHAHWNSANNATFRVQGYNGTSWQNIGPAVTSRLQAAKTEAYVASDTIGTFDSSGFSNPDFRFRFLLEKETVGGDRFQYDTAVDNIAITSVGGTLPGSLGYNTGLRRVFVATTGSNANDGLSASTPLRTIQAALNIAQPGDVISVADGVYREKLGLSNFAGTTDLPLWIVAENRGQVRISNLFQEADEGTAIWTLVSDDVYRTTRTNRPYIGSANGEFLMAFKTEADLRAASITAPSDIAGGANVTVTKPDYGFAYDDASDTIFVRLKDRSDPNGQSVKLTADFAAAVFNLDNADNVIIDGFVVEGSGSTSAIDFDVNCANPTVRNCQFTYCRHGVRAPSNTIIEYCTYQYVGLSQWARDLFALDGLADNGVFVLVKGYYNGTTVGGNAGDALLEGSLDFALNFATAPTNNLIDNCVMGPAFDGSRLGESIQSTCQNSIFFECFDDGLNFDGATNHPSDGNEVHDCRFIDCFRDISFQESTLNGDGFVYRNLFERTDPDVALRGASLKTLQTPATWESFIYHNTWIADYDPPLGLSLQIWDGFGGSTADRISNFYNNIVIFDGDNLAVPTTVPQSIERNAAVGTSSGNVSTFTPNGGVFAGTAIADMQLNADRSLQAGSPAVGIGRSLVAGNPDSRVAAGANDDAGAFPLGETPGLNWPRPLALTFTNALPGRWTSPGAGV